jgi:hypothetical protein
VLWHTRLLEESSGVWVPRRNLTELQPLDSGALCKPMIIGNAIITTIITRKLLLQVMRRESDGHIVIVVARWEL